MKQPGYHSKCFKDNIRDVPTNKFTKIVSRIPIRIPPNAKKTETTELPKNISAPRNTSLTNLPEKPYGRDRSRLMSSYGKRLGKSSLESQISIKCRKENREKSKFVKQQLSYEKECGEMRVLLEKMQINASGDSVIDRSGCQLGVQDGSNDRNIEDLSTVHCTFVGSDK